MYAELVLECVEAKVRLTGRPAGEVKVPDPPVGVVPPNRLWLLGPGGYPPLGLYLDVTDDLVDYVCKFLPDRYEFARDNLDGAARIAAEHFPEHLERGPLHAHVLSSLEMSPSCWFFFGWRRPTGVVLSAAGLAIVLATIDRPNLIRFDWIKANWRFVTENLGIP